MTRVKSLKVKQGYSHRIHRSKKNRKLVYGYELIKQYKKRLKEIEDEEAEKEILLVKTKL
jgi:hypothetical protein